VTDHTELRRKAEENLEIEEGHSQMLEFGYVATAHTVIALLDEIDALKAAQRELVLADPSYQYDIEAATKGKP